MFIYSIFFPPGSRMKPILPVQIAYKDIHDGGRDESLRVCCACCLFFFLMEMSTVVGCKQINATTFQHRRHGDGSLWEIFLLVMEDKVFWACSDKLQKV